MYQDGTRNSITMWDNGTVIEKHPIPYPAEIRITDSSDKTLYTLRGYVPLDELKQIATSIR